MAETKLQERQWNLIVIPYLYKAHITQGIILGFYWKKPVIFWSYWYNMIYLLTAIGLSPSVSSTVHIYTQTIHITTQNKQYIEQHKIWEECLPCLVFASYILAVALQLRKEHRKTSVSVAEECQLARWRQNIQNRTYITIRMHKHINKNT